MTKINAVKTIVFVLLALGLGAVIAAGTPAGTQIRNQASASYIDSAGQPQTTTSNEVVTVVQQVYGLEIKPDGNSPSAPGQTKDMLPAGTVYFNWTVKNTGNGTDTFDLQYAQDNNDDFDFDVQNVYLDENCNGQIDPGESPLSASSVTSGAYEITLAADETACVIMEAKAETPSGSTLDAGDEGNINLEGKSQNDSSKTDTNNWARAVITEEAILDASKSASPSGEVKPDSTISYTIEGANIGGSNAKAVSGVVTIAQSDPNAGSKDGILISDSIPNNTTYVPHTASGSAGAGSYTVIYQTSSGWYTSEPTNETIKQVALLIEGSGAFFPQNAQYTLSFDVKVNAGTAAGTDIENFATVQYGVEDANGNDVTKTTQSNTTRNPVAPSYNVQNGPNGDPEADGNGFVNNYTDPSGETWNYDHGSSPDNDVERITNSVYGGDTVYFKNTLKNGGNSDDSYDLTIDGVPAGWTCQFMAADGSTPLSNPVGPVAADASYDYVVKCSIPPTANTASETDLTITATSVNDSSVSDVTHDVIPEVQPGYSVDVADHGHTGGSDSDDDPADKNADPGETVNIPFDVKNTGQNPDTYDLTTTLPSGWSGTIFPDDDCDGDYEDDGQTPVTDTGLIDSGDVACFVLVTEVPDGTAPGSNPVTITATSNADPNNSHDDIATNVVVNEKVDLTFTPDRNGTVTSPGTIVYTHTLTNNGNADASVTFSESGSTHPDWTYEISTDGGSSWSPISGANPPAVDVPAGESKEVQIRVIVPDGEPIGAIDTNQITATTSYTANNTTQTEEESVTDTTTVVGGDLRLEKTARTCADTSCSTVTSSDGSEAEPGEYIEYTVTATNIGTADLAEVIITDPLPAYTDFESVSGSTSVSGATILYSVNGSSWTDDPTTINLSAGQSVYVGLDQNNDGQINESDVLAPGETLTMVFMVKVQEAEQQNAP